MGSQSRGVVYLHDRTDTSKYAHTQGNANAYLLLEADLDFADVEPRQNRESEIRDRSCYWLAC